MRIAVVNHHPRDVIGGSELQCHLVAKGLAARGHDVTYVAIAPVTGVASVAVAGEHGYDVRSSAAGPVAVAHAVLATEPDVVYWRFNRRGLREVARALRDAGDVMPASRPALRHAAALQLAAAADVALLMGDHRDPHPRTLRASGRASGRRASLGPGPGC